MVRPVLQPEQESGDQDQREELPRRSILLETLLSREEDRAFSITDDAVIDDQPLDALQCSTRRSIH